MALSAVDTLPKGKFDIFIKRMATELLRIVPPARRSRLPMLELAERLGRASGELIART